MGCGQKSVTKIARGDKGEITIENKGQADSWSGIFAIVISPFSDTLELDEEGLRKQVELCVEGGVRGIVGPANASEFTTLSDDERRRWLEIAVGAAQERVPVVASITSGHELPAVELG